MTVKLAKLYVKLKEVQRDLAQSEPKPAFLMENRHVCKSSLPNSKNTCRRLQPVNRHFVRSTDWVLSDCFQANFPNHQVLSH
jgi:hypothetical protein